MASAEHIYIIVIYWYKRFDIQLSIYLVPYKSPIIMDLVSYGEISILLGYMAWVSNMVWARIFIAVL